jgi:hypothetical protein
MTRAVIRVVQLGDLLLVRIFQHCSAPPLQSRVALLPKLWLILFITPMSAMIVPSERYRRPKIGQSSLLAFLNERLLSATSGHRIDFKDRALMINKSVALPDQIFARPELA